MTTAASLITRVRSNINEPTGNAEPQRTDTEILQWLTDGQYDYTSKIPADAVPELLQQSTFGTTYWNVPDTFVKPLHVIISHAVQPSGATLSTTLIEQCKILDIDEETAVLYWPSWAGAWAKFGKVGSTRSLIMGPNCYSGTVTYIGLSSSLSSSTSTFPLTAGHEEPVVNYATAMALAKVNDEDAPRYLEAYQARIDAENGIKYTRRRKVEKQDPQETP